MHTLDRFTAIAGEVLSAAQREAARLHHEEVTPEHIALALSSHQRAMSLAILRELGANIPRLQKELRDAAGRGRINGRTAAISRRYSRAVELAADEARAFGSKEIGTQHLLLGVIREGGQAKDILAQRGVSLYGVHKLLRAIPFRDGDTPPAVDLSRAPLMRTPLARALRGLPIRPSPIFLAILGFTALMGLVAYLNLPLPQIPVILFVLGGWLVSLCLHEFGHAAASFIGGDSTVVNKGYLTLNPLKYTHPLLSIVFPVLFLLLGGIPLPGGAVYIQRDLIRTARMRSLSSAAGPLGNVAFVLLMLIPYHLFGRGDSPAHPAFWGAYALLMFLNIFVLIINLLPIPGLDGYGILEPYLPYRLNALAYRIMPYTFFILFLILWTPNPISYGVGAVVGGLTRLAGIDPLLVATGRSLFRLF